MNFLAVDTSGAYLTVVVQKGNETFSTYIPDCAMKQSVLLMGAVDETLKKANMSLSECDCFAAVVGAGSFTGIRIGISAVKGFALAYQKPLLPITSFEVAAYDRVNEKKLCLVDALHDCYYACGFDGAVQTYAPAFLTEKEVLALVEKEGYVVASLTALPIEKNCKVKIVDAVKGLQNAAAEKAKAGAFGELNALYVRKSSAEENLAK